jgi:biopolymer transport protein ExbD
MKRSSAHFLLREPALALPLVALALNVVLIAFLLVEIRSVRSSIKVALTASSLSGSRPLSVPRLRIGPGTALHLDDESVPSADELEYRLGGRTKSGNSITVHTDPDISASRLAEILHVCSRSGFTNVALEMQVPGEPGAPDPAAK